MYRESSYYYDEWLEFHRNVVVYICSVLKVHCRKKIGDVLIVSEQVRIICRPLGIRIDQFVEH